MGKYQCHLPLERQSRFFTERYGVPLAPSTLNDWVGGAAQVLEPVAMQILQQIVSGSHISLDDTPVRALGPQAFHRVKRGHIWSLPGQGAVVYPKEHLALRQSESRSLMEQLHKVLQPLQLFFSLYVGLRALLSLVVTAGHVSLRPLAQTSP